MDKITIERIGLLHPSIRKRTLDCYTEICTALTGRAYCRFSYTLRTDKQQADLYAIGRTKPGKKVTNAKPGQSIHNYGFAFDIVLIVDGKDAVWDIKKDFDNDLKSDWMEIVAICKKYGFDWGGDWLRFKDYPHFEVANLNWRKLSKLEKIQDKETGNFYVKI
jgi:peptidoglycan LD-endopeptidase CwlK